MHGVAATNLELLARLQMSDRQAYAKGWRLCRSARSAASQRTRRLSAALGH